MKDSKTTPDARQRAAQFTDAVGHKAARKARARSGEDESIWNWLGMMGLIGWSVAAPTVAGIALGRWIDRRWPGPVSWTLMLLFLGIAFGCGTAWHWLKREGSRR